MSEPLRYPGPHAALCSRSLHAAKPERYDDVCDCGIEQWGAQLVAEARATALAERDAWVTGAATRLLNDHVPTGVPGPSWVSGVLLLRNRLLDSLAEGPKP